MYDNMSDILPLSDFKIRIFFVQHIPWPTASPKLLHLFPILPNFSWAVPQYQCRDADTLVLAF